MESVFFLFPSRNHFKEFLGSDWLIHVIINHVWTGVEITFGCKRRLLKTASFTFIKSESYLGAPDVIYWCLNRRSLQFPKHVLTHQTIDMLSFSQDIILKDEINVSSTHWSNKAGKAKMNAWGIITAYNNRQFESIQCKIPGCSTTTTTIECELTNPFNHAYVITDLSKLDHFLFYQWGIAARHRRTFIWGEMRLMREY